MPHRNPPATELFHPAFLCHEDEEALDLALRIYAASATRNETKVNDIAGDLQLSHHDAERALFLLSDLGLIRLDESGQSFTVVSPSTAHIEHVAPLERQVQEKQRQLASVHRTLQRFTDAFDEAQRSQQRDPVAIPEDDEQVRLHLADAARHCTSELLVMQAGRTKSGRSFEEHVWPVIQQLLGRGVRVRLLHQHTARTDGDTRARIHETLDAGAEVRTSEDLFGHVAVFDDCAAMVAVPAPGGNGVRTTMIYEPAMVAILRHLHDHTWHAAVDVKLVRGPTQRYDGTLDAVKGAILKLLATGLKDEVVARRLGMSPRTFRRHIATIMEELGAESRFQAGIAVARSGLLEQDWPGAEDLVPSPRRPFPSAGPAQIAGQALTAGGGRREEPLSPALAALP